MAKELKDIAGEVLQPVSVKLKELKKAVGDKKKEYDDAPVDPKDAKETKKKAFEKAQKDFDDMKTDYAKRIRTAINKELESDNLAIYSSEVAERRKIRKMNNVEDEITKAQGVIDILSLEISAIDKEIEEVRKGLVPAKA